MDSLLQIPDDEQRSRSCQSRSQVLEYTWLEQRATIGVLQTYATGETRGMIRVRVWVERNLLFLHDQQSWV